MDIGLLLLFGVMAFLAVMFIQQFRIHQRAAREVGKAVGPLPEPFATAARGDILLWFHSPSCGPCRAMEADVRALEAAGRLLVVDVQAHLDVAQAFSVMATPTTVRVRQGRIVAIQPGILRGPALEALGT